MLCVSGPSQGLKSWGYQYYLMGIICPPSPPPLVEIGLTDLPKSGSAMTHPAHLGMIPLTYVHTYYSSTYLLTYQCYEYALAKTYLVLKIIIISFHFCTATSFIKSWNLQFLLCKIKDFVWKFEGFLCQLILKFKSWEGPQKRCSQEVLRNFKWETKEGKS